MISCGASRSGSRRGRRARSSVRSVPARRAPGPREPERRGPRPSPRRSEAGWRLRCQFPCPVTRPGLRNGLAAWLPDSAQGSTRNRAAPRKFGRPFLPDRARSLAQGGVVEADLVAHSDGESPAEARLGIGCCAGANRGGAQGRPRPSPRLGWARRPATRRISPPASRAREGRAGCALLVDREGSAIASELSPQANHKEQE